MLGGVVPLESYEAVAGRDLLGRVGRRRVGDPVYERALGLPYAVRDLLVGAVVHLLHGRRVLEHAVEPPADDERVLELEGLAGRELTPRSGRENESVV